MNVFDTHARIIKDYKTYILSFVKIADPAILEVVERELSTGKLWPEPLLRFNPAFKSAGDPKDFPPSLKLHPDLAAIFRGFRLYQHQVQALDLGTNGKDFVVTSGTGSGKSLTYIGTIFNHLLANPGAPGVCAVVVYPMNALINSQTEEFLRYKRNYEQATGKDFPITFGQYTGQEDENKRAQMRERPPQILLTNYMMLELLLTRERERPIRDGIYANLRHLVFDEMHTYRGRQGADVAMLIRRIRTQCANPVVCIGTSATMVSAGTPVEQRTEVAGVATQLFGKPFTREQVVNEVLARSLSSGGVLPDQTSLAAAITADPNAASLQTNPVAIWLENKIALEEREGELLRGQPRRMREIVADLSVDSGMPVDACRTYLTALLQRISDENQILQDSGQKYTLLPFKLHQFLSQTGAVYTTLDQDENRFITLEPGPFKTDEAAKKPMFANVFSRASGHAFICVTRSGNRLIPREFRDSAEEAEEADDGYLILGEDVWDPAEDMEQLPESWLRINKSGIAPETRRKPFFPIKLFFDEFGDCSETEPLKWSGWFMKAPLLFDPTGGVIHDTQTSEGTKLTKLGSEGRSTSTTITAFSILNQLDRAGLEIPDQKLLSFTDNRQDAALQAGHFNDFVRVAQLRAGIHKALKDAPSNTLTYATIGEAVFKALGLGVAEFGAFNVEPTFAGAIRAYVEAFQDYLFYRAVADLRRSWRIVLPNLEQCALLAIDYANLDDVAAADDFWSDLPLLATLSQDQRREFIFAILDFFRLEYAIHSENFFTRSKLEENTKLFREKLRPPWTLDRDEDLREPYYLRYEPLQKSARVFSKSLGPASALGKYIKRFASQHDPSVDLKKDKYRPFVMALMTKLEQADFLRSQRAKSDQGTEVPIYRLRLEKIQWRLGDGQTVRAEVVKQRSYKEQSPQPNIFFRELYQRDMGLMKRLRGEDHTGQLSTDTRIEREHLFREGKISSLFCSPTMELGIDIKDLHVVHMRNAPPNPSNYAQRSGRAGRSGQAALIFTYCSSYSPHDRHYFKEQVQLVAGTVLAPRLDLKNQELLAAHLNALVVSEIGLPGLDANGGRSSIMNLVANDNDKMPLAPATRAGLTIPPGEFARLRGKFKRVIADFADTLVGPSAAWYSDAWIDQHLTKIADSLDGALVRWRRLYRSARGVLSKATQILDSGTLNTGSEEFRRQTRNQGQSTRQINLLCNEASAGAGELSEFYPYRYLAAEGFLPGYNFTRLPLRVFLPTSDSSGEFISRPREIALREFGPLNVIYHSGRKYRVSQLVAPDIESSLTQAKISKKVGYFMAGEQKDREICPFSGLNLADNANTEYVHDLIEMSESRAVEVDRISCEEEERVSKGFDIRTYFSVDGDRMDRTQRAIARTGENHLLNLRYIPAARLIDINYKWRAQTANGFPIGEVTGDWKSSIPLDPVPGREEFRLVKLWTSDVADALYLEPIQPLGLDKNGVITLQYALKRAIELIFQVESNEIGVISIGDPDAPSILLFEASEGSLGVLSRFTQEPDVFMAVVQKAIEVCRFDDPTYLGPASYDDLLSYYNQRDHAFIDRHLIQAALEKLKIANVEIQANPGYASYDDQYQAMLRGLDSSSSTERKFIEHLYQHGLRLPDAAQKRVDGVFVQPDFYYEPRIWIFCDGTPHDSPAVQADDEAKRQAILARGDEVWVYHYRDDLAAAVAARPDIFRKVR